MVTTDLVVLDKISTRFLIDQIFPRVALVATFFKHGLVVVLVDFVDAVVPYPIADIAFNRHRFTCPAFLAIVLIGFGNFVVNNVPDVTVVFTMVHWFASTFEMKELPNP